MKRRGFLLLIFSMIIFACVKKPGGISGVITFYNKNQPDYMSNIYIIDYNKIDTIEFNYILDYFRVIDLVKTYDYYNGVIEFDNAEEMKKQCLNKLSHFGFKNRQEFNLLDSLANIQFKKLTGSKYVTMLMVDKEGFFKSDIIPGKYLILVESNQMKDDRYLTEEGHSLFSTIVHISPGVQKVLSHNF